ncbi:hypothetical protein [Metallibacterium scheffleri]|uniref:Uncharacterized protein n=1 Tax=Metallibacterium scheffleri TaxID=993689 RepID=A0A4S3KNY0_9GAMM|nr:hypothetical protein [Metallibacterium scheffleri]THD10639.1 hypothetical protein B1806_07200 [Metallibacterium scheffleri]
MRPHILALAACVLLPLLAACSKPAADTTHATLAARAGSVAPADGGLGGTPLAPLLKDKQRARDVQAIVNRQAAKQRAQIAAQTH